MEEFSLIDKFFKPLCSNNLLNRNLNDDTASIRIKNNEELIVSKDIFVENVHFKLSDGAFNIAKKLLLCNLSDIASSGSSPISYMLGLGKNSNLDENFFKEFCRGLNEINNQFNINLIGGDTVNSDVIFFSITIFGTCKKNKILSRQNAKKEDLIYVSGTIGDAGIGLNLLSKKNYDFKYLINRHLCPTPRIKLGKLLVENQLSKCAIDVSDGLLADIKKICKSSKLDAKIYLNKIPFSFQAKKYLRTNITKNPLDLLSSGDDYELVFSINKKYNEKILDLAKKIGLKLSCIGEFCEVNEKNNYQVFLYEKDNSSYKSRNSKNSELKLIKINKLGYEHN